MVFPRFRCLLCLLLLLLVQIAASQVAVTTYHNDNARTGQNLQEQVLTPANVNSSAFGKIGFLPVQGLVDGEPLYVPNVKMSDGFHNVVYVVTEHDMVYAFDAETLAQLWAVTVVGAGETPSDDRGCSQVTPEIGITSAPVIDVRAGQNGTIYLVAMSKDGSGRYHQRLHALDLGTGAEQSNSPAEIHPTYPNSAGQLTFDPSQYKERAALLLLNGMVYTSFASHCDNAPYNGWIVGYSQTTLQQVSVFNMTPNGSEGAIWMAEGGLAADQTGNIYFLDGNGTFDTTLDANGFPINRDFGNSFMKLSTAGNSLAAADYFAMSNVVSENSADVDLGSGSAVLLPDFTDATGKTWHLAVGAGKDKNIYVVNRDSMGKFNPNSDSAIYQEISSGTGLAGGVFSTPAYFNSTVYYGAVGDHLEAFAINNARLVAPAGSQSATTFGYPGTTPAISANGATNGIVWAVENGIPGALHAYDASNLASELYNSNQAGTRDQFQDSKFNTPMVANGRVFINCTNGVAVFGLLASQTAQPPTIQLAVNPNSGAAPLAVTASTNGSQDRNSGGSIVSSWINFGDGMVVNATTANHIYSTSGNYTVIATVYGSSGRSSRTSTVVSAASDQPPVAKLTVTPSSGNVPLTVTASTSGSTDADGTISSSNIDFGDGTVANGTSAQHTYNSSGTFTVTGTVTDNAGLSSKTTQIVSVRPLADNSAFVTQQYEDFLDRQPESAGLNGWVNSLNRGVSREQLVDAFMGSQEFAGKGKFVAQLYIGLLARDADYDGFRGWLNYLESTATELQIVSNFLQSAEFQNNFGANLDNGQFVTRMYENVLLRQPDSVGYASWKTDLDDGSATRPQVALGFVQSQEFQSLATSQNRIEISLLYFDMLHRQPDPGGFSNYVNLLNTGTPLSSIINSFLDSTEYASRFSGVAHSIQLNWTASPSMIVGYNVYRGAQTGGPYVLVSTSLVPGLAFTDTHVQSGSAYFYTVTAVGTNSIESDPSNEAESIVPDP